MKVFPEGDWMEKLGCDENPAEIPNMPVDPYHTSNYNDPRSDIYDKLEVRMLHESLIELNLCQIGNTCFFLYVL